ncbi:hypothetical protein HZS55_22190 [Halosimplex rubrum]|uniref:Uncharacterized protein n=1 Tax=Halosimplex rubrum TaxID=869889 RepID=A0A7D5PD64_9EURY|nr:MULTISPECIES: hypothetical protein [Halosimplex]QLH79839.1 hypothetical protein HZS55_22190 [Halosimplex rubrum]
MPAKTGASHALAALVSMLAGTVLSKYVWELLPPLASVGESVSAGLVAATGVALPRPLSGSLVVILGLSFVWGTIYHYARH